MILLKGLVDPRPRFFERSSSRFKKGSGFLTGPAESLLGRPPDGTFGPCRPGRGIPSPRIQSIGASPAWGMRVIGSSPIAGFRLIKGFRAPVTLNDFALGHPWGTLASCRLG